MPIDYKKYPQNWKSEIRPRILARAENRCEHCGIKNHAIGYRDAKGDFIELTPHTTKRKYVVIEGKVFHLYEILPNGHKLIQIVLTIAHLDHDRDNFEVKDDRLAALCQKCHFNYDKKQPATIEGVQISMF